MDNFSKLIHFCFNLLFCITACVIHKQPSGAQTVWFICFPIAAIWLVCWLTVPGHIVFQGTDRTESGCISTNITDKISFTATLILQPDCLLVDSVWLGSTRRKIVLWQAPMPAFLFVIDAAVTLLVWSYFTIAARVKWCSRNLKVAKSVPLPPLLNDINMCDVW